MLKQCSLRSDTVHTYMHTYTHTQSRQAYSSSIVGGEGGQRGSLGNKTRHGEKRELEGATKRRRRARDRIRRIEVR